MNGSTYKDQDHFPSCYFCEHSDRQWAVCWNNRQLKLATNRSRPYTIRPTWTELRLLSFSWVFSAMSTYLSCPSEHLPRIRCKWNRPNRVEWWALPTNKKIDDEFWKWIDYVLNITCNKTTTQPSNMLATAKRRSILSPIFVRFFRGNSNQWLCCSPISWNFSCWLFSSRSLLSVVKYYIPGHRFTLGQEFWALIARWPWRPIVICK